MHEVLVNRLGGVSLPRKNVVTLTDRPDMTLDVNRGRKTTLQQQQQLNIKIPFTVCVIKHLKDDTSKLNHYRTFVHKYLSKTCVRILVILTSMQELQ